MNRIAATVCSAVCLVVSASATALPPEEIYRRAGSQVVTVTAIDGAGQTLDAATGLVVAADRVVTTCDLTLLGERLRIGADGREIEAQPAGRDRPRGLCLLAAPGVGGAAFAATDALRVGQPIFVVRHAPGLGLALAGGIVSALRGDGAERSIQISAVLGDAARGAGVFDQDGRLIGILAAPLPGTQDIGFVLPAAWLTELPERATPVSADAAPASRDEWRARVTAASRQDKPEALLDAANRWRTARPQDADAHAMAASALLTLGRRDEALSAYREAFRIEPAQPRVALVLASLLIADRKLDEARGVGVGAVNAAPRQADAWLALGTVHSTAGESEQALAAFDQAARLGPRDALVWRIVATFHAGQGRWSEATAAARRWTTLEPFSAQGWGLLADGMVAQGRHARAVKALQEAVAMAPQKGELRYQLARVYAAWGKPGLALDTAEQAVQEGHPFPAAVRYLQGHVLAESLEHDQAIAKYREALKLDPDMRDAFLGLVYQLLRMGRHGEAITAVKAALDKQPERAGTWGTLADVYFDAGMTDKAIEASRKTLSLEPDRINAWVALAQYYHANGNRSGVRETYVQIKQRDAAAARNFYQNYLLPYGEAP